VLLPADLDVELVGVEAEQERENAAGGTTK
jgi:hypothetical protein